MLKVTGRHGYPLPTYKHTNLISIVLHDPCSKLTYLNLRKLYFCDCFNLAFTKNNSRNIAVWPTWIVGMFMDNWFLKHVKVTFEIKILEARGACRSNHCKKPRAWGIHGLNRCETSLHTGLWQIRHKHADHFCVSFGPSDRYMCKVCRIPPWANRNIMSRFCGQSRSTSIDGTPQGATSPRIVGRAQLFL